MAGREKSLREMGRMEKEEERGRRYQISWYAKFN